jgi:hypothetical protein
VLPVGGGANGGWRGRGRGGHGGFAASNSDRINTTVSQDADGDLQQVSKVNITKLFFFFSDKEAEQARSGNTQALMTSLSDEKCHRFKTFDSSPT